MGLQPDTIDLPEEVKAKARLRGAAGEAWLETLPQIAGRLASQWDLRIGRTLPGGTEAYVAEALTAAGEPAVLKVFVPDQDPQRAEAQVLAAAAGRGYARLLARDDEVGAVLIERLGAQLVTLGLPVARQIEIICATLREAWTAPPDDLRLTAGDAKARRLAAFIETHWAPLGRPCSARAVEIALALAARRAAAHDPARIVVAHGDAHAWNTLEVPGEPGRFKFVDPDGLLVEPAYDLAISMREWGAELLAGDPVALGRERCAQLSSLTGVPKEPIWEWGFVERISTGIVLQQIGMIELAREFFAVADAWAQAA